MLIKWKLKKCERYKEKKHRIGGKLLRVLSRCAKIEAMRPTKQYTER